MELIRCDQCSKEVREGALMYHVEMQGAMVFRGEPKERHFCSEKCIATFYSARVIQEGQEQ